MSTNEMESKARELRELQALIDEATAEAEALKDALKAAMAAESRKEASKNAQAATKEAENLKKIENKIALRTVQNADITLEDVRDHFDQVRDETGYSVPTGVADEIASLVERLR